MIWAKTVGINGHSFLSVDRKGTVARNHTGIDYGPSCLHRIDYVNVTSGLRKNVGTAVRLLV